MGVAKRGKFLLGAGLVLGIGIALSACEGPGADYANGYGYYGYPDYYDYGYPDSFGFVGRDHDRRHDFDGGHDHGMHDHDHDYGGTHDGHGAITSHGAGGGPALVSHGPSGQPGFAGGHGGAGGFAGGHGGGGGGGGRR